MWRFAAAILFAIVLTITIACTKKSASAQIVVEIPSNFNGNFVLDMGVRNAPPLAKQGDSYFLSVPLTGKAETSTLLKNAKLVFRTSNGAQIWGLSQRVFTTGDGISVSGKIEFFVGTQKEFEAEQLKKKQSGGVVRDEASSVPA